MRHALALAIALPALVACGQASRSAVAAAPTTIPGYALPALTGRVVDRAGLLSAADRERIEDYGITPGDMPRGIKAGVDGVIRETGRLAGGIS